MDAAIDAGVIADHTDLGARGIYLRRGPAGFLGQ